MTISNKLRQKMNELNIQSVDDFVDNYEYLMKGFGEEEVTQAYLILSSKEEKEDYDNSGIFIREYKSCYFSDVSILQQELSGVVNSPDLLNGMDENSEYVVAMLNGNVVGYLKYQDESDFRNISEIVVSSDFRRRGIMTRLVSSVDRGQGLYLLVHKDNEPAQRAYENYGFSFNDVKGDYLEMVK